MRPVPPLEHPFGRAGRTPDPNGAYAHARARKLARRWHGSWLGHRAVSFATMKSRLPPRFYGRSGPSLAALEGGGGVAGPARLQADHPTGSCAHGSRAGFDPPSLDGPCYRVHPTQYRTECGPAYRHLSVL